MMPKSAFLVEDNVDDEFLTQRVLRKAGIDLLGVARDGKEAIDFLFSSELPSPDLLILDLRLPIIDGLEVLAELRRQNQTKSLPVIVLSSSDDPHDREICFNLGALAFLEKPMELNDLYKVLS